jgi:hypothetical protein
MYVKLLYRSYYAYADVALQYVFIYVAYACCAGLGKVFDESRGNERVVFDK